MSRASGSSQLVDCVSLKQQLQDAADIHGVLGIAEKLKKDICKSRSFDGAAAAEAVALLGGESPQPTAGSNDPAKQVYSQLPSFAVNPCSANTIMTYILLSARASCLKIPSGTTGTVCRWCGRMVHQCQPPSPQPQPQSLRLTVHTVMSLVHQLTPVAPALTFCRARHAAGLPAHVRGVWQPSCHDEVAQDLRGSAAAW